MLGEKDLIYFGAILIWASPECKCAKMNTAVANAKAMYDKIFKDNDNE